MVIGGYQEQYKKGRSQRTHMNGPWTGTKAGGIAGGKAGARQRGAKREKLGQL